MTQELPINLGGGHEQIIHDVSVVSSQNVTFNQTTIIQISVEEIKTRKFVITSPYKGLKKFESEDKDRFFGRDQFLAELVNELKQTDFILLLGASGSGKSSVIRAGLIPWLTEKHGSHFLKFIFTPDQDPFESFYASLLGNYTQSEVQIARTAREDALTRVVESLKQRDSYWFIFIDQFEELFTTTQPSKRDIFIASLVQLEKALHRASDCTVKIVATMRADFLDRLSPYPLLVKVTDKHRPMIADMQLDELRLAIEQPAAHHGVVFESGLVKQIIDDLQGQAGYLPLLQYTLNLLWETEVQSQSLEDRTLNISNYRKLGGVRGALQQRVNQIYGALSEPEKLVVQRIFLKLVGIGQDEAAETDWKPVRRRANRSEFSNPLEQKILAQLINQNLLVSNRVPDSQEGTIEIAHEFLLTSWTPLNTWIKENRQAIALRNRLNDDVVHWQTTKKEDELWSGSKLARILELRRNSTFNQVLGGFSPLADQFIDASVSRRDRQHHRTVIGLSSFSAVALILAGFAGWQWRQAALEQIKTLTQSSVVLLASHQGIDALIEALKAGNQLNYIPWPNDETQKKVRLALQQTVYERGEKNRLEGHNYSVRSLSFSPNGQIVATASEDYTVRLWSIEGTELDKAAVPNQLFRNVTFNTDGTMIAAISADNTIKVWRIDRQKLKEVSTEKGQDNEDKFMSGICFVPKTHIIAASGPVNTVNLWRIEGQKLKPIKTITGHNFPVWSISCSSDGKIVTADLGGFLALWHSDGTTIKGPFPISEQSIYGVNFSPDGKKIAIAGGDTTVKLWSLDEEKIETLGKHENQATSVSFSRNSKMIASTSMDNTVKLWSIEGKELKTLQGHSDRVYSASFSPDGNTLVSAGDDNTVKLWSIGDLQPKVFEGHDKKSSLYSVSFNPTNSQIIASAGDGNTIIFSDLNGHQVSKLKPINQFKPGTSWNRIWSLSFSPDGQMLASANYDRTIRLWSLNGQQKGILKGHNDEVIDVSFSPKDLFLLASASYDGKVKLWRMDSQKNFKIFKTFNGRAGKARSVSFSPDGQKIASAYDDGTIKLWQVDGAEEQQPRTSIKAHKSYITDVLFSPDGQKIASASRDKTIKLWYLDGREVSTLKGHFGEVNRLSYSRDGKILVSSSTDHTIRVWDVENEQELRTIQGGYAFFNASLSPDNKKVVGVTDDALVEVWDLETLDIKSLKVQGCKWLHDYLNSHSQIDANICKGIQ
jgi:WD40 repeat protein/energy-coupling factor transporter ATP-binding protein EcfA2